MIEYAINTISFIDNPNVEQILETEQSVYELLRKYKE